MALALLREASDELCRKTFEECNTYIKANIPRKYRDEAAADDVIRKALQMKVSTTFDPRIFISLVEEIRVSWLSFSIDSNPHF